MALLLPCRASAEAIKGLHRSQRRYPHFSRRHARAIETAAKPERRTPPPGTRQDFFRYATDGADDRLAGEDSQLRGNAGGTENTPERNSAPSAATQRKHASVGENTPGIVTSCRARAIARTRRRHSD